MGVELLMGSLLENMAFIQHNDVIRVSDCRESMSDNNCGYVAIRESNECFLDLFLIFSVKSRSCLIKNQDTWIIC